MAQISLKITIDSEIRRATVDKRPTSLDELNKILFKLFQTNDTYTIKYQDDENDLISVTHDREVIEAFEFACAVNTSKPILRLFITRNLNVNSNNTPAKIESNVESKEKDSVHVSSKVEKIVIHEEPKPVIHKPLVEKVVIQEPKVEKVIVQEDEDIKQKAKVLASEFRSYLYSRKIPVNAKDIELMLVGWANQFQETHTGYSNIFSPSSLFVLCYALIMLNTDLHTGSNEVKMSLNQWLNINKSFVSSQAFLTELYYDVQNGEYKQKEDDDEEAHDGFVIINRIPEATPVQTPVEIKSVVVDPFQDTLKQLQDMGFTDPVKNKELCITYKGDQLAIIEYLLNN